MTAFPASTLSDAAAKAAMSIMVSSDCVPLRDLAKQLKRSVPAVHTWAAGTNRFLIQHHREDGPVLSWIDPRQKAILMKSKTDLLARKANAKKVIATLDSDLEKQFAEMGRQLTGQYHKAMGGMKEIVVFGAMVETVQKVVSTCGHNSTRGPQTKGEGIKGWLEAHAPEIPRPRAYEFLKIAQGIREAFALPQKTDLAELLQAEPKKLGDGDRKKQAAILEAIEGKSRRQLLFDFGGVGVQDDEKKPTGGKRDKGKPLTPEEKEAAAKKVAAALWKDTVTAVTNFTSALNHTRVSKSERVQLVNLLRSTIEKLENVGE